MTRRYHPNAAWFAATALSLCFGCASQPTMRSPEPDVRLVAFGDSATRGPAGADYTGLLPFLLGVPASAVSNEGLSGETTDAGLRRLGVLIDGTIFPNADTLIYWQGGTDLVDFITSRDPELQLLAEPADSDLRAALEAELTRIGENIAAGVELGRTAGWTVYLATYYPPAPGLPCPVGESEVIRPEDAPALDAYVDALNARIRTVAADSGATLVDVADLGEALLANPLNYFNCNHLSALGNAQVAEWIAETVGTRRPRRDPHS
jgi:lysophospholipase L1-like esterase